MKICIIGITGRMGKVLSSLIPAAELGGASSKTSDSELEALIESVDVLIDFSTPAAALKAIGRASIFKKPIVSGTTGLSKDDFESLEKFSKSIPILRASNFSLSVHLAAAFLKKCSSILTGFDFCITEKHHRGKKDIPSGTALFLAEQVSSEVQIVSLRAGNSFGEHICEFAGENETLSISHQALNRNVFAEGALKCARWIIGKDPRLYSMQDYLDDSLDF
jgi:4-hydroxy-tetrahydrodipicolinate reductase